MSERTVLADEVLRRYLVEEMGSMRRYALSLTGSLHDADDLVQATVERVLTGGLPVDAPKAWLVRVCKNLWIDEIRKRKIRNHDSYSEEGEEVSHVADIPSNPVETRIDDVRRYDAIGEALEKLTEDHRVILSMIVVEGLSYAQVAEALELPVGTVMSRVARARTSLRKQIGGEI
ncbi:MAG: RNA polymerase sigma factor [Gammaproteobacteria bacterium]|jgi:RNA polymerase sigma factor (sigma-70 family)|nr:RNA polymerase sigma factor [Gammaproteobacteria bacterium]MBT4492260.1 RNA polymerase sigma factor [Gammaproteobacteria bacterium]MBT7370225.1 RNA polymerase sigma factor [Gammaproteobacteria bacterium]